VLISPALVGLLYGLSNVSGNGGFTRVDVWMPVVAGAVLMVAFVLTQVQREEVPHASIITRLAQQVGGAFGTAVLAIILESATTGAGDITALAHGFDVAFWWAIGFTVVAVAVCALLPARVDQASAPAPASAQRSRAFSRPRDPR